ncbi:YtxH domain-containing protein [Clostridium sp. BJN0001]|uniref:YtxH domain-containing protein n=1 Tax=Clostridium sp. BJN0001 TaxID=2930219 RepID=UPI001FD1E680|nr:YtxH domain-containing protein [Clostridium sp. BJN0001]
MKKNKLLYFFTASALSVMCLLGGCQNNTNTSDTTTDENVVEKAGEDIKENAENIGDNIQYTAKNVKDDIIKAGYEIKDAVTPDKYNYFPNFSVNETNYTYKDDPVIIYEFDSKEEMNNALKNITDDGMTIKDATTDFKSAPYYYTKENTLIIYEGTDSDYVNELKKIYTPYQPS